MSLFKKKNKAIDYAQIVTDINQYRNEAIAEYWREKRSQAEEERRRKELEAQREREEVKYSRKENPNIKYSKDVDVDDYFSWEKKTAIYKSFSQEVIDYMSKKSLSSTKFYKKAQIDRKLFSKLKTDYCYQPTKATAIKICMGLDLNFDEAEELLELAGYSLSKNLPFDLAIRYCFENGYTNVDDVNEILYRLGEKTL